MNRLPPPPFLQVDDGVNKIHETSLAKKITFLNYYNSVRSLRLGVESISGLYFFQPNEHLISSHVYKPVIINPSHLATVANFVPARPIIEDPGSVTGRFSLPLRVREPRPSRRMGSILRLETSHRHRPGTKPISSRTLNQGAREISLLVGC